MNYSKEYIAEIATEIKSQTEAVSFISEVELPEEYLDYIRKNAGRILINSFNDSNDDAKIVAAYYLVDIGIRKYDGSYWPHLDKETDIGFSQKDHNELVKIFSQALSILGIDISNKVKTKRNIEKILLHTLVPDNKKYIFSFYNFISKYYKEILNYEIPPDYETYFEDLASYINIFMDGEKIDDPDIDKYPDPRTLNVCTCHALSEPKLFKGLLYKILTIIDEGYCCRNNIDLLESNRFYWSFKEWYDENIGTKSSKRLFNEKRSRRPHMVLSYGSNFAPAIKIPVRRCQPNSKIIFEIGKKTVEPPNQVSLKKQYGTSFMQTANDVKILLKSLKINAFDKFKIKLGTETIYTNDSQKLWRVFDEDYNEILVPSTGTSFFLFKDELYDPNKENTVKFSKQTSAGLYKADIEDGTEITIMGQQILVTEDNYLQNEDILILKEKRNVFAQKIETNELLPIVGEGPFRCRLTELKKNSQVIVTVDIDGKIFHIPIKNIKTGRNGCEFIINHENFNSISFSEINLIVKVNDQKKCERRFVFIRNLRYYFDTKNGCYTENKTGHLTIESPEEKYYEIDTGEEKYAISNLSSCEMYHYIKTSS